MALPEPTLAWLSPEITQLYPLHALSCRCGIECGNFLSPPVTLPPPPSPPPPRPGGFPVAPSDRSQDLPKLLGHLLQSLPRSGCCLMLEGVEGANRFTLSALS